MARPSPHLTSRTETRGHRNSARRPLLAAAFLLIFVAGALLVSAFNPALLRPPEGSLLDGSWTADYQESFDARSPLLEPAMVAWGVIEYGLFNQGRQGVLVGEDDWLYSSEEFAYPSSLVVAQRHLAHNLDLIARVEERLAERGVDLIVTLLPAKARIYPEYLGRYRLPAGPAGRYRQAIAGLNERGVPVVALDDALRRAKEEETVFLRTDTHWTPHGAQAAAGQVAAVVRESGISLPDDEPFRTREAETVSVRGDLTNFIVLGPFYDSLGPEDDHLQLHSTEAPNGTNGDLFAPVAIPVTLVGTSYSADERWNFAGALREALHSDVLVAASEGEGPYLPMLDYLGGEAFDSSPPELVIWEIPERYLSEPWQGEANEA